MFKLVKKEKVPFHRWFFWVNKRITEACKEQKRQFIHQKQLKAQQDRLRA
jgi:hypothetical protein